jgi:hypothetical protein
MRLIIMKRKENCQVIVRNVGYPIVQAINK